MLETRCLSKGDPAGTVPLWKGGASAEAQPALRLKALQDLWQPFQGTVRVRMMHLWLEPLVSAAAPLAEHLPF